MSGGKGAAARFYRGGRRQRGGCGALAVLVPLISQMAPSADVLAESSTEVDISAIAAGQAIKAVFRKQPVSCAT
jgi:Rieske Fe-S protein